VKNNFLALGLIAVLMSASSLLFAQNPAPAAAKQESAKPAEPARSGITPLRLQLILTRYQGEKKISSLPYSLAVSLGGPPVRFRMGADLPYSTSADGTKTPSYAFRTVGVAIDVTGQLMVDPGLYKMDISVSDSSVASSNQVQGSPTVTGAPLFRSFNTNGTVLLRDGQTTQLATVADPITGETLRVDVTITVVK
jgi:Flp pilus assembly secretin CpaC